MAAYVKFETAVEHLADKVHDVFGTGGSADVLKVYLTNTAPNVATHAVKANLAEITAGNGYTAGGPAITNNGTRTGGTVTVAGTSVQISATGGSIGPFRYVVLYNDTPTSPADPLIGYWDYGSPLTLADGESLSIKFSNADVGNPGTVFTLA